MNNIRKALIILSFFAILALFMGAVSAESLNVTEVEQASTGVKNYTEANGHIPGYVEVSGKNSTAPSFLNTVTTYTVQLNQNVTTPVNKASVNNPTGPSGSATGTLQKSEYVTVANNIKSFISTNGRAPNYASSSLGNIRYESLVYMYSSVIDYYRNNNQLPDYVTVSNIMGVDSNGVIIDNTPPTVTNNLASGTYNTLKNVTLTATDNFDANPVVYYSTNDGTTWSNQVKTATLTLTQGVTNLKYYARDASGNTGTTQTVTYTIDTTIPNIDLEDLEYAAGSVQSYIEDNHQLPDNITISGFTMNMAQFLKLTATAITNINSNITTPISPESYGIPLNPSETITTSGNLNKTDYINLANSVKSYMDSNRQAPNYQTISLGNMRYESLVYTFAQILKSYQVAEVLPNYITVRPWMVVSNNSTTFITMDQIKNAADTVQSYIETNHQLPEHVTIAISRVSMPQFLKLELTCLLNANDNLYQSIPLGNYGTAPNPSESITGGDLSKTDYLSSASYISTFMDTNGRAPNYRDTVRGYIRYESLVYIYTEIINSASKNKHLPDYITLTPWTTVSNSNTVFITMDQINTAVWTVKSYVETNHALPSNVNISGRQITMPQFLKLEITSLKNIQAGLYQSIVLRSYNAPTSPSETLTAGKINSDNYLNAVASIKSYMDSNGQAPNYSWTSQGNMRYENLVYMYSQILNYYNVENEIPQYVTVNPWSVVSNPNTVTFNVGQIISGAETVKTYVETNHALPDSVTISGTAVSMPQFLKLLTTTLHNINSDYVGQLVLGSYGLPIDTSETITGGTLNQTQYLDLAKEIEFFMYGDGRAPNFQNSSLGNIRYQSLIYMYSQILSSYKANNYTLPDLITVRPWSVVSNTNTKFITTDQLKSAAGTIKSYVETNHTLPSSVTISGTQVTMPQFLKLATTAVSNINGKLNTTVVLQSYNAATSPSETVTGGSLDSTAYISITNNIISFMDSNGRAPDYTSSSLGNIRYESLVYMYSLILDYYNNKTELPQNITITPWTVVSNTNTAFFTTNQIETAAKTVQSYVETNHQLPDYVTISGTPVNMPQFLQLATTALLNIDNSLHTSIALKSYNAAPSPSETITTSGNIANTDYIKLANDIIAYMYANGQAPNYQTINLGNIRFESLVYMYSQILSSYNATNTLPKFITVNPWTVVSNSSTVFITTDQIKNVSQTVKSYVNANHTLPSNATISGRQVSMPQFLKLSAKSIINIESYLNTSVILDNVGDPTNPTENITSGTILSAEFVDMATNIKSYMDSNGIAPNNVTNTSVGDTMGYESLVYMFSTIMSAYNATGPAPDEVSVIPWLAMSNPDGTFNFRTQKIFSSIQEAIDDADTISGDTIWLRKATYSENVVINREIIIRSISGVNVTVHALDPNLPIFTINTSGNGTTIQNLILNGSTGNACIYINNSTDNQILGNNITGNSNGIHLYNSTDNIISGNEISNNSANGVLINTGSDNEVSSNKVTSNGSAGISIQNSNNNKIYSNTISNNQDGIYLNNSSTEIYFNIIVGNSIYGLYNEGNGTVNATNNWWGSNNPIISSTSPSDIYTAGGNVTYDPWLVLSINSSTDRSDRNGTHYNYQITADLTHNNQGNDTSSDGNIPDDIPINFVTTLGTINTSGSTKKGRAELKLTSSSAGAANVSVTLNNQTVSKTVDITSVDILGVYNTRTQESFATIQGAVDDVDTFNGDTITLADGTYTENVVVYKRLTIQPATGANATVKAANDSDESDGSDKSVFVISNGGSGSTIQGLNIISSSESYGISLSHSYNNNVSNNTISDSNRGIYLYLSGNNILTGNIIKDSYYGIFLYNSTSNNISGGIIKDNENGIYLLNSNYNLITGSTIANNYFGSYFYHSSDNNITGNNVTDNWVGVYLYETKNNNVAENNITDNGAGITYCNSIGNTLSGNNFADSWLTDTSVIDSGEMIMATTIYTCGPAALATILKSMGIYTTEAELTELAGTDETGTSLYGLKTAAQNKGVTAVGARLTIDQLKTNYIVVLSINGVNHFEVIKNITNSTVYLFDPNLGNIEMTLAKFNELYTGNVLIINDQAPANATILTDDEMRNIKAMRWVYRTVGYKRVWVRGYWYRAGYRWVNPVYRWEAYLYFERGYREFYGGLLKVYCTTLEIRWRQVLVRSGYWEPVWKYKRGYWKYVKVRMRMDVLSGIKRIGQVTGIGSFIIGCVSGYSEIAAVGKLGDLTKVGLAMGAPSATISALTGDYADLFKPWAEFEYDGKKILVADPILHPTNQYGVIFNDI